MTTAETWDAFLWLVFAGALAVILYYLWPRKGTDPVKHRECRDNVVAMTKDMTEEELQETLRRSTYLSINELTGHKTETRCFGCRSCIPSPVDDVDFEIGQRIHVADHYKGDYAARVMFDSVTDEYVTELWYRSGSGESTKFKDADYFTDDLEDCIQTTKHMLTHAYEEGL